VPEEEIIIGLFLGWLDGTLKYFSNQSSNKEDGFVSHKIIS
jgi:hypothetical protein